MKPLYGLLKAKIYQGLFLNPLLLDTLVERVKKVVPELLEVSGIKKRKL
jgi:hypothetical protein